MASHNAVEVCRDVMESVAASVAVLTLVDGEGQRHGMTISSLTPVSADPPSVLVCVGGAASSRPFLVEGQRFGLSVLSAGQQAHSMGFAFGAEDPFETFGWTPATDGTPILDGAAAHLICDVERVVDHHGTAVVLAGVVAGGVTKNEVLVYWKTRYFDQILVEDGGDGQFI